MQNTFIGFVYMGVASAIHDILHSPPLITKQPPTDELYFTATQQDGLKNDMPFIIECEAEGVPEPAYKWMKNGKEFNLQGYGGRIYQRQNSGTLIFTISRDEDVGQYQCYAYNQLGVATSNSVFVYKTELFGSEPSEERFVDEGKPFQLPCTNPPHGSPKPRIIWVLMSRLGAIKTINSSRITSGPGNSLWFSSVEKSDESSVFYYACLAYSPYMNKYKLGQRVFLSVFPNLNSKSSKEHNKPFIQYVTRNAVALRGSIADLWCIIGGKPLPKITWGKVNGALPYDRIEYEYYGKVLRIKDADFSDEGSYFCQASNGVDTPISITISLEIQAPPYFTVEPEVVLAAEGETVEFKCEAGGKPAPKISWVRNGKPLNETKVNPRRKMYGDHKIIIEEVATSDLGNYGCNASNSLGYVYKDVYLNVLVLPAEITERPVDVVTANKKDVTLKCRPFGVPRPLVQWTKSNQILTGPRFQLLESGDLEISNVTFDDAGLYTCIVRNNYGNATAMCQLSVKEPTQITQKPEDQEVSAGTTATFRCNAIADSTLTLEIVWLSDGREEIDFESEMRYKMSPDNSLTIERTTELDSGVYTCVATTEFDSVQAMATLTVQDVPNRPELTEVICGPREAKIMWKAMGDNRSPILHYTIEYSNSRPDLWEIAQEDVPAINNSYTISKSISARYKFRVIAINKIGRSHPSIPSEICN